MQITMIFTLGVISFEHLAITNIAVITNTIGIRGGIITVVGEKVAGIGATNTIIHPCNTIAIMVMVVASELLSTSDIP